MLLQGRPCNDSIHVTARYKLSALLLLLRALYTVRWWFSAVVTSLPRWAHQRSYSAPGPVNISTGDRLRPVDHLGM